MRQLSRLLLVLFIMAAYLPVHAQHVSSLTEAKFLTLKFGTALPKNIMGTKSVVFIKLNDTPVNNGTRGDWKNFADEAHQYFKKAHIDAVAYYYFDDVFSSSETIKAFAAQFKKRQIANIIIWRKDRQNNVDQYTLVITPFNGKESFIDVGQGAWKVENNEASSCLSSLYRMASQSGFTVKNLMISDVPEFFSSVRIVVDKRYEAFPPDLKNEKLAVLKFPMAEIPESGIDEATKSKLEAYNSQAEAKNSRLEEIMKTNYPFEFSLVDPKIPLKEIRNKGYQFVINSISAPGAVLKNNLDYKFEKQETDYISVAWDGNKNMLTKLSAQSPVIKYYVKQTFSKSVYLGTKWDTAIGWEQSLMNYLNNLKKELVN